MFLEMMQLWVVRSSILKAGPCEPVLYRYTSTDFASVARALGHQFITSNSATTETKPEAPRPSNPP